MPGVAKFVSSQPQYSALWREPEAEVIPLCEANGISQIVWSPLAQGVLTGKYRPGEKVPADSRAANKSMNRFIKQWLSDDVADRRPGAAADRRRGGHHALPARARVGAAPAATSRR